MKRRPASAIVSILILSAASVTVASEDPRNIRSGSVIPDEGYCDQPYVVITKQGHWLCTFTTGKGREGQRGQHVVASISTDKGKTWSTPPIDIEPADGPEALVQHQDAVTASNTKPPSAKPPNSRVRPPAIAGSWYPKPNPNPDSSPPAFSLGSTCPAFPLGDATTRMIQIVPDQAVPTRRRSGV